MMGLVKHHSFAAATLGIHCLFLASLLHVSAAAEGNRRTGPIRLPHTKAETDAIVADLSAVDSTVVLHALKSGKDILRQDFRRAVAACLSHRDPQVREAAWKLVLPCEITSEYPGLAKKLDGQFPGPLNNTHPDANPDTGLRGLTGPVFQQFESLGSAAIPVLAQKLNSENPKHRMVAMNLLGLTASPAAAPALTRMLSDSDPSVRRRAVRALGHIATKTVRDRLFALRNDDDNWVLRAVAIALSQQRDERALKIWQDLILRDTDGYATYRAGTWISRFSRPSAIPVLIAGLAAPHEEPRALCRATLKRLTWMDFGEDRSRWSAWWNSPDRKQAYEILGQKLAEEKDVDTLVAIVMEGDTRAIPFLLENYGKVQDRGGGFTNEQADTRWALRMLSAKNVARQTNHYERRFWDDTDEFALWRNWHDKNKETIPRRSPLVDPHHPLVQLNSISISTGADHLAMDGHLLFVGCRSHLEIFDYSDETKPEKIARYWVEEGGVEQFALIAGRLFLTTHSGSLYVYRYTRQGDLEYLSTHDQVVHSAHFMTDGRRLLLGKHVYSQNATAALYDISGDTVKLLDTCDAVALRPFTLSGAGGFFTTANWRGDRVVTNDCFPMRTVQRRVWPEGTALADNGRFYCIDHGLLVVRDLNSGKLLGSIPARAGYDAQLVVRGDRAYAVLDRMGIVIYDVSDAGDIKVLSHTPLPTLQGRGLFRGLLVTEDRLLCANVHGQLLDFELPESFRARGRQARTSS
jgi:hypothetical protein